MRDFVRVQGNRFVIEAHPTLRKSLLTYPGASPRRSGEITFPLNLISWNQLNSIDWLRMDMSAAEWFARESEYIRIGQLINSRSLETWDMPDMWEWQAQAKERLMMDSACLFDDRGMGKTRTVIETLRDAQRFGESRAVVVTSHRLRAVWEADIGLWWGPEAAVAPRARVWSEAVDQIGTKPITILTYESLQNEDIHSALCAMEPDWLILEEAHNLKKRKRHNEKKNAEGDVISRTDTRSGLVRSIPSKRRIAITGTPMPQRWHEVWTLLNFIAPDVFTSYWHFVEGIGEVTVNFWGGKEISYDILEIDVWEQIFDRWVILRDRYDHRRTVWDFVPVELSKQETKAYKQMQKDMVAIKEDGEMLDAPNVLAQLVRMEQIAGGLGDWKTWTTDDGRLKSDYTPSNPSAKTDMLIDMVAGLRRAVVFTKYRKRALFVAEEIEKRTDSKVFLVIGGLSEKDVNDKLKQFADNRVEESIIMVCVFGTISEGVNELVAAHDIFFLDWATTKDVAQAADRLDRPGQKKGVRAVTLYARDTIDELTIDRENFKMVPIREALRTPDAWSFLLKPIDSNDEDG